METKTCCTCKLELPVESFNWQNKSQGIRQRYCRTCKQAHQRKYYQENKEQYQKVSYAARQRRKEKLYENLLEYFALNPCVDCGEADFRCLQFDHVRGDKVAEISTMVANGNTWSKILQEIAKCEVRCANCHWKVTATRGNWYAWMD